MGYLTQASLNVLKVDPGKYHMDDRSSISKRLQPFWNWVSTWMPVWLSANIITVGSIGPLLVAFLASYFFYFNGEVTPTWLQLFIACSIFFFQTMDAVDGLHARRLGTCSPLGDLLDHVVDQICLLLCILVVLPEMGLAHSAYTAVLLNICGASCFFVQWEACKTKLMVLDDGTGITEGQLALVAVSLVAPIFGQWVWQLSIPFAPFITLAHIVSGLMLIAIPGPIIVKSACRVYEKCGASCFSQMFPYMSNWLLVAAWVWKAQAQSVSIPLLELIICANTWICVLMITLERITNQPLLWHATLHIFIPAIIVPFLPFQGHIAVFCYIALTCSSLIIFDIFLSGVLNDFTRILGVPLFAQPKTAKKK